MWSRTTHGEAVTPHPPQGHQLLKETRGNSTAKTNKTKQKKREEKKKKEMEKKGREGKGKGKGREEKRIKKRKKDSISLCILEVKANLHKTDFLE